MSHSSRRSVYLADEQWEALREVAAKLDRPVNWVVRQAVTVFLDTYRPAPLIQGAPPTGAVIAATEFYDDGQRIMPEDKR